MRDFFRNLKIKPVFNKTYLFIGIIPFEYHGQGFHLMLLPTLGFVIRWGGFSKLDHDLSKIKWGPNPSEIKRTR